MQSILKIPTIVAFILCTILIVIVGTSCDNSTMESNSENLVEGLEISNTQGINNQGVLTVTGDVKNISGKNIKKLVVTVTFYDGSMNELTSSQDICEDLLLPDDSYHFKVNCLKKDAEKYEVSVLGYN